MGRMGRMIFNFLRKTKNFKTEIGNKKSSKFLYKPENRIRPTFIRPIRPTKSDVFVDSGNPPPSGSRINIKVM